MHIQRTKGPAPRFPWSNPPQCTSSENSICLTPILTLTGANPNTCGIRSVNMHFLMDQVTVPQMYLVPYSHTPSSTAPGCEAQPRGAQPRSFRLQHKAQVVPGAIPVPKRPKDCTLVMTLKSVSLALNTPSTAHRGPVSPTPAQSLTHFPGSSAELHSSLCPQPLGQHTLTNQRSPI